MKRILAAGIVASLAAGQASAADDPATCQAPSFSDVGWTDISATTATAARILEGLGYASDVSVLSVAVTFESLKQGDTDIFLGNWMPVQEQIQPPLVEAGDIEIIQTNLEGARIGFAVPKHTFDAGLKTYSDIAAFHDQLDGKIYSIEAGSSANATILEAITDDTFGLSDFELVESSEQGMLAQVERAMGADGDILFFGWRPHPMNVRYEMEYLTDGDDMFGPDDGAATVLTVSRAGFSEDCPNLGKFFKNLVFNVEAEDLMMAYILDEGLEPRDAAERWLSENPEVLDAWLADVTTLDGEPGLPAVQQSLGL